MDIKDGAGLNDGYMAGYFDPNDMWESPSSNKMYMLYLDVIQGNPNREDFFATVAHELQHLIRRSVFLKTEGCAYPETWLNEGLSLAAEYVYSTAKGQIAALDKYYVDSFNGEGRESAISEGNNFFVWLDDKYVLDEYATAYFFFQWLRIQADNDTDIYKDIIASITAGKGDYQAVLDAATAHIGDPPIDSWEVLIRSWLLANYVQAPNKNEANGLYGYNGLYRGNNEGVPKISIPASSKDQIRLYAGEGAYSNLSETGFTPPGGSGSHIKYVGVTGEGALSGTGPYTGTRLLTFNSNSSTIGTRERGYLTGSGDPPKSGRFSRQSSEARFPYRVDTVPPLPSPGRDTGPVSE
jgi:hypothetical protein